MGVSGEGSYEGNANTRLIATEVPMTTTERAYASPIWNTSAK